MNHVLQLIFSGICRNGTFIPLVRVSWLIKYEILLFGFAFHQRQKKTWAGFYVEEGLVMFVGDINLTSTNTCNSHLFCSLVLETSSVNSQDTPPKKE